MRSRSPRVALALLASLAVGIGVAPGALSQPSPKPGQPAQPPSGAPRGPASASASAKPAAPPPPVPATPAAPAPSAPAPAPSASAADVPIIPVPTVARKVVPPPPAPTPQQLAGLQELEQEADAYEKDARDYRRTITGIIKHHYEDQRRRVLSALDNEIAIEKKGLRDARDEAIRRLEAFVAKYSGPNAHPENTPDAMFRLAALYEEKARTDTDSSEDLAVQLKPAISLYKRIIREFPHYRELAGIYYYLGHAYNDSSRLAEAQQVWRSLVCHNLYAYPTQPDPKDTDKDVVVRLPQDHDRDYWTGWDVRHPTPIGGGGLGNGRSARPARAFTAPKKKGKEVAGNTSLDDEVTFRNPYTEACRPIAQKTAPGAEPRYLAEVWWLIGDYHFNEVDPAGGPFNYNRAEAAYQQSIKYKKPPVHGVSMYKLAWTYFKQQRYETSVHEFVDLLHYTDQMEKETGDTRRRFPGRGVHVHRRVADVPRLHRPRRRRALHPAQRHPRHRDRLAHRRAEDADRHRSRAGSQADPAEREVDGRHLQGPRAGVQGAAQLHNNIEVDELILKKWPMHRDAPVVQNEIADLYDKLTAQSREGTAERKENAARALAARTKLSAYVGSTPWTDANKNDPEALQTADRLVHGGLRRAAADHTNAGSALVQQAIGIGDKTSRDPILERALTEYKLAAQGWDGYLKQDTNASDAYESRYWLADANHNVVVVLVMLDRSPSPNEVDAAKRTAVDVRDSNEDDKYLQPAAFMVVDTAQQVLNDQYKLWDRSHGAQGIEKRDAVKTTGEGDTQKVVKDTVPAPVIAAIAAREEYIQRVAPSIDLPVPANIKEGGKNADLYAYDTADFFFVYGQFVEAKKRLEPIYRECKKNKTAWGYKAWSRLMDIAALEHDVPGSRKLAEEYEKDACPTTPEQKLVADLKAKEHQVQRLLHRRRGRLRAGREDARRPRACEAMAQGRRRSTRSRSRTRRHAMRRRRPRSTARIAFKQVGDYDQAIEMYTLFIKEYGNEENLKKLERGDTSVTPPKAPNPSPVRQAGEVPQASVRRPLGRVRALLQLPLRRRDLRHDREEHPVREAGAPRGRARAVTLYANIGDEPKMLGARTVFMGLDPPPEKRAEIDYQVALADFKGWDEHGLDEGANHTERLKAQAAMDAYYGQNKSKNEAAAYVVMAAYNSAKLRKAGKDPKSAEWCRNTIGAFEKFRTTTPDQGRQEHGARLPAGRHGGGVRVRRDRRADPRGVRLRNRPPPVRRRHRQGEEDVRRGHQEGRGVLQPAPGRYLQVRVPPVVGGRQGAARLPLRLVPHRPLQRAPARPEALHRQGGEAPEAGRDERPRGPAGAGRRHPPEAPGGLALRPRALAQRRRQGDGQVLHRGGRLRSRVQGAERRGRHGHPAARVPHQHPRGSEAPRVQPGRRRSGDQGSVPRTPTASSSGRGRAWRRRSSPTISPRRSRSFHERLRPPIPSETPGPRRAGARLLARCDRGLRRRAAPAQDADPVHRGGGETPRRGGRRSA